MIVNSKINNIIFRTKRKSGGVVTAMPAVPPFYTNFGGLFYNFTFVKMRGPNKSIKTVKFKLVIKGGFL